MSPTTTIICGRHTRAKRCSSCGRPAAKLCDFPLTGSKSGQTCSLPVCERCALHRAPDTDYCAAHGRLMQAREEAEREG